MSGPITVVQSGTSVQSAQGTQILLNSKYPFTKLDTQNTVSFQTISVLFNSEPTQPPSSAPYYSNTLIYQFPHGYNYIPATWMEWQNPLPEIPATPSPSGSATTYYAFGDDSAGGAAYSALQGTIEAAPTTQVAVVEYNNSGSLVNVTNALLYTQVDETNVYIYLMKTTLATVGGNVIPLYMAGDTLNMRCYVFTEPANTSTY